MPPTENTEGQTEGQHGAEGQTESQTEGQTPDLTAEAALLGWVPKEDFHGNADDWVDAETFVRRGKEINPILRKNNAKLMGIIAELKNDLQAKGKAIDEFRDYHAQVEERAYKRALADLKAEKTVALREGDAERVIEIDDQIDAVKEEAQAAKAAAAAKKAPPAPPPTDPALDAWMAENPWFNTDREMTNVATAFAETLATEGKRGADLLKEVDKKMRKAFPEKLGNPNREKPATVEGGSPAGNATSAGARANKRSYENLPAAAKAACDNFVKQGLLTREKYLANYDWS